MAGQSSMALPVKIASCFGVLAFMKSQTPSPKLQTNLKLQYQMTETGLEFGILVIVICPSTRLRVVSLSNHLIFDICDLEFLIADTRHPEIHRQTGKATRSPRIK